MSPFDVFISVSVAGLVIAIVALIVCCVSLQRQVDAHQNAIKTIHSILKTNWERDQKLAELLRKIGRLP